MKDRLVSRSQGFRHETQFDQRLHPDGKEKIVNLIGVKRTERRFFALLGPKIIREKTVKTHVTNS